MTPELHAICERTAGQFTDIPESRAVVLKVLVSLCEAAYQTGRLNGVCEAQAVVEANFAIARARLCA